MIWDQDGIKVWGPDLLVARFAVETDRKQCGWVERVRAGVVVEVGG